MLGRASDTTSAVQHERTTADQIIQRLRADILGGQKWHLALLEAVQSWQLTEERQGERFYSYLTANEAFDWLLLAERLCEAVADLIPAEEIEELLFYGRFPVPLSPEEFRELIGPSKYRAFLNYFYGVTLEECLILAVEQEVEKEQRARIYREDRRLSEDAYQRIYGATELELAGRFREERGALQRESMDLLERKEFTYWLFKFRLKRWHKARVASDTRKALSQFLAIRGEDASDWCASAMACRCET